MKIERLVASATDASAQAALDILRGHGIPVGTIHPSLRTPAGPADAVLSTAAATARLSFEGHILVAQQTLVRQYFDGLPIPWMGEAHIRVLLAPHRGGKPVHEVPGFADAVITMARELLAWDGVSPLWGDAQPIQAWPVPPSPPNRPETAGFFGRPYASNTGW